MFSGAKCGDGGGPKCRSAGPSSMMFKVEEIRCKLGSIPASPISARLQCMQDVLCTLKKMRQYCKQMTSLICRGVEKGKGGKGSGQGRGNGKDRRGSFRGSDANLARQVATAAAAATVAAHNRR